MINRKHRSGNMVGGASLAQFALFGLVLFANGSGISEAYGSTLSAAFLDGCDNRLTDMHPGGIVCLKLRAGRMLPTKVLAFPFVQPLTGTVSDDLANTAMSPRCLFIDQVTVKTISARRHQCDKSCSNQPRWLQQEQLWHRLWGTISYPPAEKLVAVASRDHSGLLLLSVSEATTLPSTSGCSLTCRGMAIWDDRSTSAVDYQSIDELEDSSKQKLWQPWLWRTLVSRLASAKASLKRSPIIAALVISACSSEGQPQGRPRMATASTVFSGGRDIAKWTGNGDNTEGYALRPTISEFPVFARRLRREKLDDGVTIDRGTTTPTDIGPAATAGDKAVSVQSASRDAYDVPTAKSTTTSLTVGDDRAMPTRDLPPAMAGADDSLQATSEHPPSSAAALLGPYDTVTISIANSSSAMITTSGKNYSPQGTIEGGSPQADTSDERALSTSRSITAQTAPSSMLGESHTQGLFGLSTDRGTRTLATMGADMPTTMRGGVAEPPTIALTSYVNSSLADVAASSAGSNETSIASNTGVATNGGGGNTHLTFFGSSSTVTLRWPTVDNFTSTTSAGANETGIASNTKVATGSGSSDTLPPFFGSSYSATLRWPAVDNFTTTTIANVNVTDSSSSTAAEGLRSLEPSRTREHVSTLTFVSITNSRDAADSSHATTPTADSGKWQVTGSGEHHSGGGADVEAIVAGVTVTAAALLGCGIGAYVWYRKKYPVRMPIGRKFVTHTNPEYKVPPVPMVTLVKDEV